MISIGKKNSSCFQGRILIYKTLITSKKKCDFTRLIKSLFQQQIVAYMNHANYLTSAPDLMEQMNVRLLLE